MQAVGLKGFRLSLQQTRLWSLQKNSQAYHALCAIGIEGLLDQEVFEKVLQGMINRHEILRTFFYLLPGVDTPVQAIADHPVCSCPVVDLQHVDAQQQQAIAIWMTSLQTSRIDLQHAPLGHFWLLQLSTDRYIWLVSLPALCADTSTLQLLVYEFQQLYTAYMQHEQPCDDPLQYADVSAWQDSLLQKEDAEPQLQYWREKDFSLLDTMRLPFTREQHRNTAPTTQESFDTFDPQMLSIPLDNDLVSQIKMLAERSNVSVAAFLLTCWQIVLWRLRAESHFLVGVACDGRIYEELTHALGLYTRFVPVDAHFEKDLPFEQILAEVALSLEEVTERQIYFAWETAWPTYDQSINPRFFPVSFEYDYWPSTFSVGALTLSLQQRLSDSEPYFLKLSALQVGEHLQLELYYNQERIGIKQAQRITSVLNTLLFSVVAQPTARVGTLRILSPDEQDYVHKAFQSPTRPVPEQMLHQIFEIHAAQTPQQPAIIAGKKHLTYQELNVQANQLACMLRDRGVGPNVLVGLCVHRSVHMIVCLLAILKAGGTYVPLDPENPPARLTFQLQDVQASLLLTQQELLPHFTNWEGTILCLETVTEEMQQKPGTNLPALNEVRDIAYVMYTSGSTGVPKGVLISQQSVVNYTLAMCELLHSQPGWHYATVSTLAADLGNTSIFCALASGGCLHVLDYETITSVDAFARWVSLHPIDVLKITPSHLSALLTAQQSSAALPRRALILGGEALPSSLLTRLRDIGCSCTVYNHYGPTEATIGVLVNVLGMVSNAGKYAQMEKESSVVPLGSPITNSEVYVLDQRGQIVPIGVTGELYLGGAGLAMGYAHRPELTAACFVPHPFSQVAGARLYRTGDLVRYRQDGSLDYLGRKDGQVKLRGYRIELGEIEQQLRRHPQIREAVVLRRTEEGTEDSLVGYIVPWRQPGPDPEQVRAELGEQLPAYMVPAALMLLEHVPLTANGKLDRARLPAPQVQVRAHAQTSEPARTPIEEVLMQVWAQILNQASIRRSDNFFQVGGHSLLGTRMIARLRAIFGVELPITWLFEAPTLALLAERVEGLLRGQEQPALPAITPASRKRDLPLSFAQQRLWFLHQLHPQSAAYHVPGAVRLVGSLDVVALQASLHTLLQRHESLRTTFEDRDGLLLQRIGQSGCLYFPFLDLSACLPEHRETLLHRLVQQEAERAFDLAQGPLWRMTLLKLEQQEYVLLLTMHHIISDGWSMSVLIGELSTLYQAFVLGESSPLAPLPIQYADYALWQRSWLQAEVLREQVRYWTQQLSEARALELPGDYPRSQVLSHRGGWYSFQLEADLALQLGQLSRQEGVTLFMTLLAAFQILLSRLSGQLDIVVGTDSANRSHLETEGLIGFFVNLLALRTRIIGKSSFSDMLREIREMILGAYMHQELPFEMVVEHLRLTREGNRTPLVNVLFVMRNVPMVEVALSDIVLHAVDFESNNAKFDLALFVTEESAGLRCAVNYSTDLFKKDTVARMMSHYDVLLRDIVAHPESPVDNLEIYTAEEKHLRSSQKKKRLDHHLSKLKDFKEDLVNLS